MFAVLLQFWLHQRKVAKPRVAAGGSVLYGCCRVWFATSDGSWCQHLYCSMLMHAYPLPSSCVRCTVKRYFLETLQFDPEPFESDEEDEEEEEMVDLGKARAQGVGQITNLD